MGWRQFTIPLRRHQSQLGWNLRSSGAIPSPPKIAFGEVSDSKPVDENQTPPKPKSAVRGGDLQRTRVADSPLDKSVVQVVNLKHGTVNLFVRGSGLTRWKDPRTVCGRWQCGMPDAPARGAEFSRSSDTWSDINCVYGYCEACYGSCYPVDRCVESPGKVRKESESSSSSSSESES